MISVNQEITIPYLESLFKELAESAHSKYVDLQIHPNLKFRGFGSLTLLIQLIITWRRLDNYGRLIVGSKELSNEDLESFIKKYYGLIAAEASREASIINFNGTDLTTQIRTFSENLMKLLRQSNFEQAARGDSILFPFFDHLDFKSGLLPILYNDEKLRSEEEFENICNLLIDIATKNNRSVRNEYKSLEADLKGIIYEAFDNTNKWARHSTSGRNLNPSLRGIYGRFYKLEYKNMSSYTNSIGLEKFFSEIFLRNPALYRYITFLEISIFDSGPGLVPKYSTRQLKDMTIEEEYKYLIECLRKHNTSHKEIGFAANRGIGLHRIMSVLNLKKGYMQIRSGRLSLSRDFLKVPFYASESSPANYVLLDVDSNSSKPTEKAKVEGTLMTIIIPQIK